MKRIVIFSILLLIFLSGCINEEQPIIEKRTDVAEKWVRYAKAPTGLVGNISTSDVGDDQFEQSQAEITDKYGRKIHYSANAGFILGEENELLQKEINEKLIQLLEGETTAQDAYDEIMGKVV